MEGQAGGEADVEVATAETGHPGEGREESNNNEKVKHKEKKVSEGDEKSSREEQDKDKARGTQPTKKKKKHKRKEKLSKGGSSPTNGLKPIRKLRNNFYITDDGTRSLMLDCLEAPPPYLADNEFEAHEIVPNLFLGDYSSASKRDALKERRVTHIVNCARIARKWFPQDFAYLHLEIDDHPLEDILVHFDRCAAFIAEARQSGAVLVHCMAGISRSASVVLAYLIKYEKMSLKEALKHAKELRAVVNPNPGFMQQLEWYERMGCDARGKSPAQTEYRKWKRQRDGACLLA